MFLAPVMAVIVNYTTRPLNRIVYVSPLLLKPL